MTSSALTTVWVAVIASTRLALSGRASSTALHSSTEGGWSFPRSGEDNQTILIVVSARTSSVDFLLIDIARLDPSTTPASQRFAAREVTERVVIVIVLHTVASQAPDSGSKTYSADPLHTGAVCIRVDVLFPVFSGLLGSTEDTSALTFVQCSAVDNKEFVAS